MMSLGRARLFEALMMSFVFRIHGLFGKMFFEGKNFSARIMDTSDGSGHDDPTIRSRLGCIAELIKGRHAVKKPINRNDIAALLVGGLVEAFFRQKITGHAPVSVHVRGSHLGKVWNVTHRTVDPGRVLIDIVAVVGTVAVTLVTADFRRQLPGP